MSIVIVDHTHEAAASLPLTEDQKVDARALHGWLGIGTAFNMWMLRLLRDYGFEEGVDYDLCRSNLISKGRGGHNRKDYLLTLTVAKEIAMIGNTPKGRATRRYFIAAEEAAVKMAAGAVETGVAALTDAQTAFIEAVVRQTLAAAQPAPAAVAVEVDHGLPEWVTARSIAEKLGLVHDFMSPRAQSEVSQRIGYDVTGFCRLNDYPVEQRMTGGQQSNRYPREAALAFLAIKHAKLAA